MRKRGRNFGRAREGKAGGVCSWALTTRLTQTTPASSGMHPQRGDFKSSLIPVATTAFMTTLSQILEKDCTYIESNQPFCVLRPLPSYFCTSKTRSAEEASDRIVGSPSSHCWSCYCRRITPLTVTTVRTFRFHSNYIGWLALQVWYYGHLEGSNLIGSPPRRVVRTVVRSVKNLEALNGCLPIACPRRRQSACRGIHLWHSPSHLDLMLVYPNRLHVRRWWRSYGAENKI